MSRCLNHPDLRECACSKPERIRRRLQFVSSVIVLGLSAYTLSQFTGWLEVRFVVGASAFAILTNICINRYDGHLWFKWILLPLDFINCAMSLAASIVLAEQIACDNMPCAGGGGGYLITQPCIAIYVALAFAIITWILFGISFSIDLYLIIIRNKIDEKDNAGTVELNV